MCWTDERHSRSDRKMERSSGRTQVVSVLPRTVGIDGEAIEFEGKMFPDFRHCIFFKRSKKTWRERTFNPKSSRTGSSSCQCSMTLIRQKERMMRICIFNVEKFKNYTMKFSQGHWTFLGPVSEEKWYGSSSYDQKGKQNSAVNKMVQRFKETGHSVFKSISALSRGILKKKKGGDTINLNGDSPNTELLFHTIHSVNQLSIYGAVANWCQQFGLTQDEKGRANLSVDKKMLTSIPPGELQLLVSPPTMAPGNGMREKHFELRNSAQ